MAFFMAFPYTDLYQLNLDWLLETVKRLENKVGEEVVNTFNTRSGNVELNADDVNALMIELVYIGNPGEDITDITPAELQQMYDSGKRLLLLKDSDGVPRDLYVLDIVGETATATKYVPYTSGDVVTSFNNRSGAVALLASDVNATRIDITWISDPGDDITDLSQEVIDEMFNDGVRALIFINNDGNPEQLYFLSLVGDVVTPVKSDSGVISVNNKTGVVVLFGADIALRTGVAETVDGAVTSIRNNIGTMSALNTDEKTSLVAAINEVDNHADNAASAAAAAQTTANNAVTAAAAAQTTADQKADKTLEINGHALSADFDISANEIPASGIGDRTASGNPLEIEDAIEAPAKKIVVAVAPVQNLNGYDAPWPAGGGRNLCPMTATSGGGTNGLSITVNNDLTFYATKTGDAWGLITLGTATLKAGSYKIYEESDNNTNAALNVMVGDTSIANTRYVKNGSSFSLTEDTEITVTYGRAFETTSPVLVKAMIYPSTDTDTSYSPYSNICPINGWTGVSVTRTGEGEADSTTYPFAFPAAAGTVYGGTLTVNQDGTGELVVDRAGVTLTGNEAWNKANTPNSHWRFFYTDNTIAMTPEAKAVSNMYKNVTASDTYNGTMGVSQNSSSHVIMICDERFETVEEFKAYLATAGVFVSYTLTAPVTYQLTAAQVQLLAAYNYLFTNGNRLALTYLSTEASNVQAEIDEFENVINNILASIAPVETSPATANHSVGDYIMLNSQFCKVTSAIAAGESIVIGQNVVRTSIARELLKIINS